MNANDSMAMGKKAGAPNDLPIDNDYTPYNPNINS